MTHSRTSDSVSTAHCSMYSVSSWLNLQRGNVNTSWHEAGDALYWKNVMKSWHHDIMTRGGRCIAMYPVMTRPGVPPVTSHPDVGGEPGDQDGLGGLAPLIARHAVIAPNLDKYHEMLACDWSAASRIPRSDWLMRLTVELSRLSSTRLWRWCWELIRTPPSVLSRTRSSWDKEASFLDTPWVPYFGLKFRLDSCLTCQPILPSVVCKWQVVSSFLST